MLINPLNPIFDALGWWNQLGFAFLQLLGQNSLIDSFARFGVKYLDALWFVVCITVFAVYEWRRANKGTFKHRLGVMADTFRHVVVGVVLVVVVHVMKYVIGSPRPISNLVGSGLLGQGALDVYVSFPSLHAALFMYLGSVAGVLVPHYWFRVLVVAVTAWISLSRVVVGYHYPIDILAGCLLGLVAFLVVHRKEYT